MASRSGTVRRVLGRFEETQADHNDPSAFETAERSLCCYSRKFQEPATIAFEPQNK